ncbi:MAG: hypothetical protein EHM35_00145 [Planctomycetaceae bacterium]|nr:MAG: hypothetical protein EHM35_00145 [Planctomycetaceae bacterium]
MSDNLESLLAEIEALVAGMEPQPVTIDIPGIGAVGMLQDHMNGPVRGDVRPEDCDHRGAWCGMRLRCPACGAPMFLSAYLLARRSISEILTMRSMWKDADCPDWEKGRWWHKPDRWTVIQHPFWEATGGLPVLNRLLDEWQQKWLGRSD